MMEELEKSVNFLNSLIVNSYQIVELRMSVETYIALDKEGNHFVSTFVAEDKWLKFMGVPVLIVSGLDVPFEFVIRKSDE